MSMGGGKKEFSFFGPLIHLHLLLRKVEITWVVLLHDSRRMTVIGFLDPRHLKFFSK